MNPRKKLPNFLLFLFLAAVITLLPPFSAARADTVSPSTLSGEWVKTDGKMQYRYSDNTYASSGFVKIGKYQYYFNRDGVVKTGWITEKNNTYYASKKKTAGKRGKILTGWHTINGNTYYFAPSGAGGTYGKMFVGWQVIDKKTFYFNENGILQTGWKKISGKYFYFQPSGNKGEKGKMYTGWHTIKKKKYYFRSSGKLGVKGARYKSEWVTIKNQKYYFNSNGTLNKNTMTEAEFIETIGELASRDMKKSHILASVTTAQAILESGYGTTSLAMEAHNLFGMKATLSGNTWKSNWTGKTFKKSTQEYLNGRWYTVTASFRSYSTFLESIEDHSNYLTYAMNGSQRRYNGVVGNKSYKKTIQIIKNGGYATDPQYVSKICSIIKRYRLTKYDK